MKQFDAFDCPVVFITDQPNSQKWSDIDMKTKYTLY